MKASLLMGACLVCLAAAPAAFAEELETRTVVAELADDAGVAPLDRSAPMQNAFQFSAGEEDGSVSLRFSRPFGDGVVSFTASAPTDDDDVGTLATLDGFGGATSLEVSYTGVLGRLGPLPEAARAICDQIDRTAQCDEDMVAAKAPERLTAFRAAERSDRSNIYLWGLSAKGGTKSFDYYDPTTLAEHSTERTPWGVSAFIYGKPFDGDTLVTVTYSYQETYRAADTLVVCPGGAPPVVCVNGPIGEPSRRDAQLASVELRRRFQFGEDSFLPSIGVSAQFTYDFESDVTGIDVPIYFLQDEWGKADAKLTGGVRLGWRDDTDDFTVGLFISQPFSILGD